MPGSKQLRVGGYWLASVGAWGDLTWSTRRPGGCYEASWSMDLPPDYRHPALERGKKVEVMDGMLPIWTGTLTEPDRSSQAWSLTAEGLCREAEHYFAFDGSLNTVSTADTAVDNAITRGLPWIRRDSIATFALVEGDTTGGLNTVAALLDAFSDRLSQRWEVDAAGVVTMTADRTTPTWHLTPGVASLGVADDEYASHVYGRFQDSGNAGAYTTVVASDAAAAARWGHREYPADLTPLGPIPASRATSIVNGILAKGKGRPGYTNGLEVTSYELTNAGGNPADLSAVVAGQVVRAHGMFDDTQYLSGQPFLDMVLGEVSYTDGSETVNLTPLNTAPRTLAAIQEAQMRRAAKKMSA